MKNLTYSLCYNPKNNILQNTRINYMCSDRKVHIRLRDFDKEQVISGFERKLAYLMTYLVNYSNIAALATVCSSEIMLEALSDSADAKNIIDVIKHKTYADNLKGFKIFENYKRKDCKPFGNIDNNVFPISYAESGEPKDNNLKSFLDILRIDLENYLFNDGYSIIIYEDSNKDINKKFNNKEKRKKSKIDFAQLW